MAQLVKTVMGLAVASVKTVDGLAIASVKTVMGVDNTSGGGGGFQILGTNGSAGNPDTKTATLGTTTVHTYTGLPANTFLCVSCACENEVGVGTFSVADSQLLTWTARGSAAAGSGNPGIASNFSALCTAGGSCVITVTFSQANKARSSVCYAFGGAETTYTGNSGGSTGAQAQPLVSIAALTGNYIIAVTADFNAVGGARTYRTPPTITEVLVDGTAGVNYQAYHYYGIAGSNATFDMGLTAPGGEQGGTACMTVKSA